MALKVADLGHTAATERVHLQWTKRLEAEFYTQGDKERELGLTVSPLMDRTIQTGISKSQVSQMSLLVRRWHRFVARSANALLTLAHL